MKFGDHRARRLIDNILVDEADLTHRLVKPPKFTDARGVLTAACGPYTLTITRSPFSITIADRRGVFFSQNADDVKCNKLFASAPAGFYTDHGISRVRENLTLAASEFLYGLGEKFMSLNKVGRKLLRWAADPGWTSSTDIAYKNIPLFLSSRGYGLFINTANQITYDIGASSSLSLSPPR